MTEHLPGGRYLTYISKTGQKITFPLSPAELIVAPDGLLRLVSDREGPVTDELARKIYKGLAARLSAI